jgi:hypothetical protein
MIAPGRPVTEVDRKMRPGTIMGMFTGHPLQKESPAEAEPLG